MARFIAIPVAQGDAFYLEADAGSVLVDGGRSALGFADLFRKYTGRDGVDVLVTTHNDADHANGVLGFLQAGLMCKEVWLPGRWAELLPQVLRPWEEVVHVLLRQVEESRVSEIKPKGSLLEQYAETVGPDSEVTPQGKEEEVLELGDSGWPVALISRLEEAAFEEDEFWALPWWEYRWWRYWWWPFDPLDPPRWRLFTEAIVAASRIRRIALTAYHRGIGVRWFAYDTQNPGGGYSWLVPLNSRKIASVKPIREEVLFRCLALTVQNKESLVFWVPPGQAGGGVLFTADSDLKGLQLPILDGAVVTAPHHGSSANANVYSLINQQVIWVRSDGQFRARPCPQYLGAQGKMKLCTICRNPHSLKQPIILVQRTRNWVRGRQVRTCACK